jgi:hypothetical protein
MNGPYPYRADRRDPFGRIGLLLALALSVSMATAQNDIENVVVETYYVADANDATDTIGGGVPACSRTYRVYIDLCTGCGLRMIYGSADHALWISSTAPIFNHLDRGRTYGHEMNNGALDEGTVALDSWLSMGAATNQKYGILKADDPDGSIVGGANNDGGSAEVAGGLLANNDPAAGIPLTERDGLVPLDGGSALPPTFLHVGDDPSQVFGDSTLADAFVSNDARISCSTPGTHGPTKDNCILIAQVTTCGELSFELNVEIEQPGGALMRYVATDTLLAADETANGLLVYPPQCGCMDPQFLEYDPTAGCDDGSCQTTIQFGCMDTQACNFDPDANFNVPQLCCYGPDSCNGLDISIVCPTLGVDMEAGGSTSFLLRSNPTGDDLVLERTGTVPVQVRYTLHDPSGRVALAGTLDAQGTSGLQHIDISPLTSGMYLLHLTWAGEHRILKLVKE